MVVRQVGLGGGQIIIGLGGKGKGERGREGEGKPEKTPLAGRKPTYDDGAFTGGKKRAETLFKTNDMSIFYVEY